MTTNFPQGLANRLAELAAQRVAPLLARPDLIDHRRHKADEARTDVDATNATQQSPQIEARQPARGQLGQPLVSRGQMAELDREGLALAQPVELRLRQGALAQQFPIRSRTVRPCA